MGVGYQLIRIAVLTLLVVASFACTSYALWKRYYEEVRRPAPIGNATESSLREVWHPPRDIPTMRPVTIESNWMIE